MSPAEDGAPMNKLLFTVSCAALAATAVGCSKAAPAVPAPVDMAALEAATHGAYITAINGNTLDAVMADLTDDVVYQSPNEPEVVGKDAVRKWAAGYIDAYSFKWEKTSIGLTTSGDWAFERYAYRVTNTDKKTKAVSTDEGKGVNVFHHDADGKWRVAIDSWNSNLPVGK
jgi:ketosteroid isomerase-like protein